MEGNELRKHMMVQFLSGAIAPNLANKYQNPRDTDIFVVGPPKSGTTWLQQILHQIRTKGDETFRDIYDVTWYISSNGGNFEINLNGEQVCNPRVYKHHEAYGTIIKTDKQKQIVINRDPYDCAYSYTKFVNRYFGGNEDISDAEMADMTLKLHRANKLESFNCLSSWWPHRDDPNVLFVFYEDFLKDLKFMIRKIADFIGIPLTDDELKRVTHLSSFDYMKEHKDRFQGEPILEGFARALNVPKWSAKMGMVREDGGQYGQGAKGIGPQMKSTVDLLWAETIEKPYGYKNYAEMYEKNSCFKQKYNT